MGLNETGDRTSSNLLPRAEKECGFAAGYVEKLNETEEGTSSNLLPRAEKECGVRRGRGEVDR
jgi:hypothetical protein